MSLTNSLCFGLIVCLIAGAGCSKSAAPPVPPVSPDAGEGFVSCVENWPVSPGPPPAAAASLLKNAPRIMWRTNLNGDLAINLVNDGDVVLAGTHLIIPTLYGIYIVDKSGIATRASGWPGDAWDFPSPVTGDRDGTFYFSAPDGMYAMNPDGTRKWCSREGAIPTGEGVAGSSYGTSPALDPSGGLYVFSNDGNLRAFDASTGRTRWTQTPTLESGESYNFSQILAGAGDSLFAGIGGAAT